MNGILIVTRAGVALASVPLSRPAHRRAGTRPDIAAGGSAGNRAIRTLAALLRRAFGLARTDRQAAAHTDAGMFGSGIGRGLSLVPNKCSDGDAMQDRAIAKQDPDIASAGRARRLSSIAGMPSGDAIEGTAMSTIALPPSARSLQNPPAAGRIAGLRWLHALTRLWHGTAASEATEIRFSLPVRPLSSLGFREFTAPRRLQGGGALRLRTKAAGRIAAFDGLQSKRGRQR